MTDWAFPGLAPQAYQLILADPPTEFQTHSEKGQGKSASRHYDVESIDDIIAKFPIRELADPKGCLLVMWSTWALSAPGEHTRMIRGFGFKPVSGGAWAKVTANGLPCFGTGYVLRDACEPFWTARIGRLPRGLAKTERNLILACRRDHSQKPEEMQQMLERLAPDARKCELFARRHRENWDVWGKEVDKYDPK